jgi:hypothetical protein
MPEAADEKVKESRHGMEARREIKFLETGSERDRARFPAGAVGGRGDEKAIAHYVKNQGRNPEEYGQTYKNRRLELV